MVGRLLISGGSGASGASFGAVEILSDLELHSVITQLIPYFADHR